MLEIINFFLELLSNSLELQGASRWWPGGAVADTYAGPPLAPALCDVFKTSVGLFPVNVLSLTINVLSSN